MEDLVKGEISNSDRSLAIVLEKKITKLCRVTRL